MDKSWIDEKHRFSTKYACGVESFIEFANINATCSDKKIHCPCIDCRNTKRKSVCDVKRDLYLNGFNTYYRNWIYHGEPKASRPFSINQSSSSNIHIQNEDVNSRDEDGLDFMDELPEMIEEIRDADYSEPYPETNTEDFERLLSDASRDLYPNCKGYSLLKFISKLLHIKVMNKMTNKAVDMILSLFKEVLPDSNIVPQSIYWAKKILSGIGLGYMKIEACKYDCALFWKEYENEISCPVCGEPRWKVDDGKGKRIPHKVLRYFLVKSRLRRLFMSSKTASYMRWHAEKLIHVEGSMSHPSDSPAWKHFDSQFPDFASDPRNVRLGLATDGFNPFGNMSLSYSMWPVILIPYNMPLYKCMKDEFLMMALLIPGPRAPGKDIDVYLRPLIDELKELWCGVNVYDACKKQSFQMRAAVMWTINEQKINHLLHCSNLLIAFHLQNF